MTVVPLMRTSHEAHLHMDLTPCPACGEHRFDRASAVVTLPDGDLGRRYAGRCAGCGAERAFTYRLPADPLGAGAMYGGPEPSQLIDAAQWLQVADWYAGAVPAAPHKLPAEQRRVARGRLAAAVAALDEVLKFVPPGTVHIPDWAVWTDGGRAARAADPDRLHAGRLGAARAAYAEIVAEIDAADLPGDVGDALAAYRGTLAEVDRRWAGDPAEHAQRRFRVEHVFHEWATRHGIDDRDWSEDGWDGPDRRSPTAAQAWELVRAVRSAVGLEPGAGGGHA